MSKPSKVPEPSVLYDFDPHNLPPEMLQAIGLLVASASQTENIMQDFIGALLRIDSVETLALTAHMSIPLKNQVIQSLAELNIPIAKEIDLIDDLLEAAVEAFAKRNALAHNAIMTHPDTRELLSMRASARGSLLVSLQPITVEQVQEDAALIYQAGMDIMAFMISRNLAPVARTRPVFAPLNRKKKARAERRDLGGSKD